jgi:hypothetical protein
MVGHTGFVTTARLLRPEERGSRPGVPGPPRSESGPADGDRFGRSDGDGPSGSSPD